MEQYRPALLKPLAEETPTGKFNRALTAFRTRQAAMGNDELQRYKELCGLIGEGRCMEEFAASGVYDFEDYYNALLDAENITNMWKSIKRSISIGIKKPFLRGEWEHIQELYPPPKEKHIAIAKECFLNRGAMCNLDLTLLSFEEVCLGRLESLYASEKNLESALKKMFFLTLRKPLDKWRFNRARRR
jgi:hypothetical protein